MNKKFQLLAASIVIGSILIATQAWANLDHTDKTVMPSNTVSVNVPPGPEADPYLRHHPASYDFENELPPNELAPLQ